MAISAYTYLPGVQRAHQLGENRLADDRVDGAMSSAADELWLHEEVAVAHTVRWKRHRPWWATHHRNVVVEGT